jgi:3-isopropylmalate/(R)-2-methylmalate dehydratase large subunit
MTARTLFEKIWQAHEVVPETAATPAVLYVDLHLVHEVTTPQAFAELEARGLSVRRPGRTLGTLDHSTPTEAAQASGRVPIRDASAAAQVAALERNARTHGVELLGLGDARRGIVHVIGPELGRTQPGMTIVCGDSHTSTHGAFGTLAFGIGTTEVGHVLATQCLLQRKPRSLAVTVEGALQPGVEAKDLVLAIVGRLGVDGGTGHVIEYRGAAIRALSMEGRMTVCNMSIEAGARAGMVSPDATTFDYLRGRPGVPAAEAYERAVERWRALASDPGAVFDREVAMDAGKVEPMISYGTNPGMVVPVGGRIPERGDEAFLKALRYMGFAPGDRLAGKRVDFVFVGSCTNSRLSDLRSAAAVLRNRRVAAGVRMLVVPGSQQVKRAAEQEGLHEVFAAAGAEWRESGCSMCIGMNGDVAAPASTS